MRLPKLEVKESLKILFIMMKYETNFTEVRNRINMVPALQLFNVLDFFPIRDGNSIEYNSPIIYCFAHDTYLKGPKRIGKIIEIEKNRKQSL